MRNELKSTVLALMLLALMVVCVVSLVTTIREEDACWDAGYELPVYYAGETWCFGRDGAGVAVPIADVSER